MMCFSSWLAIAEDGQSASSSEAGRGSEAIVVRHSVSISKSVDFAATTRSGQLE
jgi:hypothetical protein